jgi:hypothetical protein
MIFVQTTKFLANNSSTTSKKEVTRVSYGDLQPGATENWSGGRLVIPPVPPSFLEGCSFIDINYYVEVSVY